eukprot:TRINITY_DN33646_c0_g1_i7.p1 TRINITY_DN33646_c0_g1~~TRINITY_DN33646_c0_g1_i7.p1  ORF type:complete len:264 (+),score=-38.26 TRINITY_DN33646_c0_g1_i7:56-847(+)
MTSMVLFLSGCAPIRGSAPNSGEQVRKLGRRGAGVAVLPVQAVRISYETQLGIFGSNRPRPSRPVERRAASRPPGYQLADHVGQQAEEAGALDRLGELALLLLADGGDARRHDLAALGDVALQQTHVLVVDLGRVGARERAGLATTVERAPGRDLVDVDHYSAPPSKPSRGRRGPRSPPSRSPNERGPRSPRSPKLRAGRSPRSRSPKPPRSERSSRFCIMADAPSSCASTLMVRKRSTSSDRPIWRSISLRAAGGQVRSISV